MPVTKDGQGRIIYTPKSTQHDGGIDLGTGVYPAGHFAVADEVDVLKQIQFDPSSQATNTVVRFKSQSLTPGVNVTYTFPNVDTDFSAIGGSDSFTTMQVPNGTSPVATSSSDTLTWTSADSSVTITGDSTTDTIDLATRYSNSPQADSEFFGISNTVGSGYYNNFNFGDYNKYYSINSVGVGTYLQFGHPVFANLGNNHVGVGGYSTLLGDAYPIISIGNHNTSTTTFNPAGCVLIGSFCTANYSYGTSWGHSAVSGGIGAQAFGAFAVTNADGQLLHGSSTAPITEAVFGAGLTHSAASDLLMRNTNGSGSNVQAGDYSIQAGRSTGNATPGSLRLKTSTATTSGSSLQTATDRVIIDGTGRASKQIGATTNYAAMGGTAYADMSDRSNSGTGETDLGSYTLSADSLAATGDFVRLTAFGVYAATVNNKTLKVKLGSTTLFDTGALAVNGGVWNIKCEVYRTGSSTQRVIATASTDNALLVSTATYTAASEDLTTNLTLKVTGTGGASTDITERGFLIEYGQI